ncbi:autophagy-related protein 2 homolog B [Glossina fuscipes]|uniref:Autophagy-related protein 2 n=1 Tax=Glossina fuscipes TaxID=7396 RepID=A0A9C5ZAG1_9MUSC|nr:autophagy-related protein 2 homolog B [Glossina fuscipes]
MSWFNVWDGLKNKTCRYLLQRYLGQFLDEQLNLEQLKIELFDGKATVNHVLLRVEALNELLETQGWPFEFTSGYIGRLTVSVPWNTLMTSDSSIEADNVTLCFRPVKRSKTHDGTSMLESMWSSVSSSLQLAEECMRQNEDDFDCSIPNSIIGLEKFAETIDNVLNRITANISNITVIIEYPLIHRSRSSSFHIHLEKLNYKNETGSEQVPASETYTASKEAINLLLTYAKHNITISGIQIFTEEFKIFNLNPRTAYRRNENIKSEKLPVLQIKGQQNILMRVKQAEEINGPKISFDIELGSIFIFASPRQIHLVISFFEAFNKDDFPERKRSKIEYSKCLNDANFEFNRYKSRMAGLLNDHNNWSDAKSGDNVVNSVETNCISTDSYCGTETYCGSVSSSSVDTRATKCRQKFANNESCVEISNFAIKITEFVGIILQEEILLVSDLLNSDLIWKEESFANFLATSNLFFSKAAKNPFDSNNSDNFCKRNHVLLRMHPIFAEGKEQRNKNMLQLNSTISATSMQLCEILQGEVIHLINFNRKELNLSESNLRCKQSAIYVNFTNTNHIHQSENSSASINITLEQSILEFDVSLYDRLSALFGSSPFGSSCENNPSKTSNSQVNVFCSDLHIKVRFPIMHASALNKPDNARWCERNIREDLILMKLTNVKCTAEKRRYSFNFREMAAFYCEKSDGTKTEFLRCRQKPNASEQSCQNVQVLFQLAGEADLVGSEQDSRVSPKPYSSKKICRQTNAAINAKIDHDEHDTILFPGETHEINAFCKANITTCKLKIIINVPVVDLFLESKQLYEVIYNRLNCDLFMWEPCSPYLFNSTRGGDERTQNVFNGDLWDSVYVSAVSQDTRIYSDDQKDCHQAHKSIEDIDVNYLEQSETSENYEKSSCSDDECSPKNSGTLKAVIPSNCCVELNVIEVSIAFYVPVRNTENHILPEVSGKFLFIMDKAKLFFVNGYQSNNNLAYLCLQVSEAQMYHCGIVPMNLPLNTVSLDEFMQATFYKVPEGLTKSTSSNDDDREMVSVVFEIKKIPARKLKRLKITTGLKRTTLRYIPSLPMHSWLTQLLDFLDVADYPIEGYQPFNIITEMQLHLWDCAIDFRPPNFSYRAVVEVVYFSVSSNIISSVMGCNLRFILEEGLLSIAPYDDASCNHPNYKITFIQCNDLVPVLDVGLTDISLRLNERASGKYPKLDLRCSIYDFHLRTCYDSGSALAQLISHIVSDPTNHNLDESSETVSISENIETTLISNYKVTKTDELFEKQQERINKLMAQALQEAATGHKIIKSTEVTDQFTDSKNVFYFPGETNESEQQKPDCSGIFQHEFYDIINFESKVLNSSYYTPEGESEQLPQVTADFGEVKISRHEQSCGSEDDYCVIKSEEKEEMVNYENLKILSEPLEIVDNHFYIPTTSSDLLKSPDNFPTAEYRYTLCEMTFTWHLYGGHDFSQGSSNNDPNMDPNKSGMSEDYSQGVSYSKVKCEKKPKEKITWKSVGGRNRNHEVLVEIELSKVRFSRDVYPLQSTHASRHVILINEIEIRDRLQSSDINKFLYNPNLNNLSNKSKRYMVLIKALFIRPTPKLDDAQECSLRISLSPMRLHIDQDTLEFLSDFFYNFGKSCDIEELKLSESKSKNIKSSQKMQPPVMLINDAEEFSESVADLRAEQVVNENILQLIENNSDDKTPNYSLIAPIFFREVIFSPEVSICFDYHGRRVAFSKGPIAGLLMGLGQLQCSKIVLKKIIHRRGLLGFEKLICFMCKEWLKDIKRNQLPKILSGVGPTYAFVQLFQGIYDLIWLPIEHYQKDGRVIRGIQLGAQSFSARTILAALELTSRIIQLLQFTAETAFDIVSPGPSIRRLKKFKKDKKRRLKRPKDICEGVVNAYQIVKDGINDSASNLIETAMTEHDQKGITGAVGAVIRQVPQLVVCPAVLATQATTNILGGVKSSLVPEANIENKEKWKDDNY